MAAEVRPLWAIAKEIINDPASQSSWWCAGPYLDAMRTMTSISERYGADSGDYIVRYALGNLKSYRGDTARRVKAELRGMLK